MPIIGTQQSPIRIITEDTLHAKFPSDHLVIEYSDKVLAGTFKGHDFEFAQLDEIIYRGKKQKLVKIHIHRPAEHLINDEDAAAFECHLVHVAADDVKKLGPKVVIGVFFSEKGGVATPAGIRELSERLKHRAATGGIHPLWRLDEKGEGLSINPNDFLPAGKLREQWYHYQGSLTSGAFTEDVSWFVMATAVEVDPEHVKDLKIHAEQEARPVHALDRRFVLRNF